MNDLAQTAGMNTSKPVSRDPADFPRRVLLAVSGLSPQIVTETLYALAVRAERPWIPTEIHLLTTARGAEHARLNLLSAEPGWFHRLCADYGLPEIHFDADGIEVIRDAEGAPLADIRSQADNDATADALTETVRALTADPDCALHVSIAGGRKTMGYYLGYALSLFGRTQDRLSHVLVDEGFESHPQFYYPSPTERVIHTLGPNPRTLDCRNAQVTLAEIPFVRLREGQPAALLTGNARFSDVVAALNRALASPHMVLSIGNRTVTVDDQPIKLGGVPFAVLVWLAERTRADAPPLDWATPTAADDFLATARRVMNEMGSEFERVEEALEWRRPAAVKLARYFEPHKTRINKAIAARLGARAALRYTIRGLNMEQGYRIDLPLTAAQIEIGP